MHLLLTPRGEASLVLVDSQSCAVSRDTATNVGFQLMKGKRELLGEMLVGLRNETNGPGKPKDRFPQH